MFAVNAKTTARINAKRSEITKNDPESVLCGLKSLALVFSGRYHDISGLSFRLHLQASQADLHRQVHVHAGIPCKCNHYMHACICLASKYPEALSHSPFSHWHRDPDSNLVLNLDRLGLTPVAFTRAVRWLWLIIAYLR